MEFAVVAPIFLLLFFGMIDFGRMIMVQQLLTDAAREGARAGVLDGAEAGVIRSNVEGLLDATSVDSDVVTVDLEPADLASARTGDAVTVRISVSFRDVCWLPTPRALGDRTLAAVCTMRHE